MKALVLGTAGHVDHGKTSLVKALTGVDTDRWKEEKERGLTIDVGFARLDLGPELEVGVVDVPGHEDFVKNMLVGCTGVDVLLLAVAADEGPMRQTREHLMIARLLGIRRGVVALTKSDRATPEWRALAAEAVEEELAGQGLGRWPIVQVSSATGAGMPELLVEIRRTVLNTPERPTDDCFRLPVDRVFSVAGVGTVVTGTTWSGQVSVGDEVRILPGSRPARVRSVQVHGDERRCAGPGRRCALALVGVGTAEVSRGCTLVRETSWQAVSRLGVRVEIPVRSPRHVEHGSRIRLFLGTAEVLGRILTPDQRPLRQGDTGWALLECERPVVARVRDRFVLRFFSPVQTVGGGRVAALNPPGRWRRTCDAWAEILDQRERAVHAAVRLGGGHGVRAVEIPLRTGLSLGELKVAPEGLYRLGDRWYHGQMVADAGAAALDFLRSAHEARPRSPVASLETLRASLAGRFSDELTAAAVAELEEAGAIVIEGPGVRLPDHAPRLSEHERGLLDSLEQMLRSGGFEPPPLGQLQSRLGIERALCNDLLGLLVAAGRVVRLTPQMFLTADTESRLRGTARKVLASGEVKRPGAFKDALGVSRKYLIPMLEYLDRVGVTRRTEEGRVLAEPAVGRTSEERSDA